MRYAKFVGGSLHGQHRVLQEYKPEIHVPIPPRFTSPNFSFFEDMSNEYVYIDTEVYYFINEAPDKALIYSIWKTPPKFKAIEIIVSRVFLRRVPFWIDIPTQLRKFTEKHQLIVTTYNTIEGDIVYSFTPAHIDPKTIKPYTGRENYV